MTFDPQVPKFTMQNLPFVWCFINGRLYENRIKCDYLQSGSISHPSGNPMTRRSISGKSTKSQRSLASISLSGEIMFRKYLMIQMLKYILRESVGRVIQEYVIRLGIVARMVFCLFHTRAW